MHVVRSGPGVKVFSAKSYFMPIHESFLPRKISAIWYHVSGGGGYLGDMYAYINSNFIMKIWD